jgi:hypothetical protein
MLRDNELRLLSLSMNYGQPFEKCKTKRKITKKINVASKALIISVFVSFSRLFNVTTLNIVFSFFNYSSYENRMKIAR